MSVNGTLAEDKMRRFKGECEHFSFNKCPIETHDDACMPNLALIETEQDYSAWVRGIVEDKRWEKGKTEGGDKREGGMEGGRKQ